MKKSCLVVLVFILLWAGLAVTLPGRVSAAPVTPWPDPEGDEFGRNRSPVVGPPTQPSQVWSYAPPNYDSDFGWSSSKLLVAQDGSIYLLYRVLGANSERVVWLEKRSWDGAVQLWRRQLSASGEQYAAVRDMTLLDNGDVVVLFKSNKSTLALTRYDPQGSCRWTTSVGVISDNYDRAQLVRDAVDPNRVWVFYWTDWYDAPNWYWVMNIWRPDLSSGAFGSSVAGSSGSSVDSYVSDMVSLPGGGVAVLWGYSYSYRVTKYTPSGRAWEVSVPALGVLLAGSDGRLYHGRSYYAQGVNVLDPSTGALLASFGDGNIVGMAEGPDGSVYLAACKFVRWDGYTPVYDLYVERYAPAPGYSRLWSLKMAAEVPGGGSARITVDAEGNVFGSWGGGSYKASFGVSANGQLLWTLPSSYYYVHEVTGFGGDGRIYRVDGAGFQAYNNQNGLLPPPAPTASVGGLAWDPSAGRGYVVLSWNAVRNATGYKLHVFDGYAYRQFDVGSARTWDSRVARIYPSEEQLASYPDNTVTSDIFNHVQGGLDLRDDPRGLYRKTAGTTYDASTNYWFRVSAYNPWCPESPQSDAVMPILPNRTDPVPPSGSLTINDGAMVTGSVNVTLQLSASDSGGSGLQSMRFSNDGVVWSPWYPYAPTYSGWSLSPGEGTKTVYAEFRDGAGNVSPRAAAQIYLRFDLTPPEAELKINGGAEVVSSTAVTLTLIASDNATPTANLKVRYSNDGQNWTAWEVFKPRRDWTLTPGEGPKVVYVQVMDENGNVATAYALTNLALASQGAVWAASGPGGGPVAIPAAAAARLGVPSSAKLLSGSYVLVGITPPAGVREMRFSFDGVRWEPFEPLQTSKGVFLPPGDGVRVVWVQFESKLPVSQVFVVDTQAPRLDVRWLGDAAVTSSGQATLVLEVQDNLFLPSELQMSTDGGATWVAFQPQVTLSFSGTGYKVVRVGVRDPALNTAWKTLQIYNP